MLDFLKSLYKKAKGIDKKDIIEMYQDVKDTVENVKEAVQTVKKVVVEIKEKLETFINDLKK